MIHSLLHGNGHWHSRELHFDPTMRPLKRRLRGLQWIRSRHCDAGHAGVKPRPQPPMGASNACDPPVRHSGAMSCNPLLADWKGNMVRETMPRRSDGCAADGAASIPVLTGAKVPRCRGRAPRRQQALFGRHPAAIRNAGLTVLEGEADDFDRKGGCPASAGRWP